MRPGSHHLLLPLIRHPTSTGLTHLLPAGEHPGRGPVPRGCCVQPVRMRRRIGGNAREKQVLVVDTV